MKALRSGFVLLTAVTVASCNAASAPSGPLPRGVAGVRVAQQAVRPMDQSGSLMDPGFESGGFDLETRKGRMKAGDVLETEVETLRGFGDPQPPYRAVV